MGLEKQEVYIYLNIRDGRLIERVPKGTPGAIECIQKNSNGEEVPIYKHRHNSMSRMLVNISVYPKSRNHPEWGECWVFTLKDDAVYKVQVTEKTGYFTHILNALPNCNFALPIYFNPYDSIADNGKHKNCVTLRQPVSKNTAKIIFFRKKHRKLSRTCDVLFVVHRHSPPPNKEQVRFCESRTHLI
jgi:hypothetical protein